MPCVAGSGNSVRGGVTVDHSSLAFLLKASLNQRRKEEEEEARRVKLEQDGGVAIPAEGAEGGVGGARGPPEPHSKRAG